MSIFSRRVEKLESNLIPDDANWEIVVLGEKDPEPENPEGRNRIIVRGIAPAPRKELAGGTADTRASWLFPSSSCHRSGSRGS